MSGLFRDGMVVVAEDAGDLPRAVPEDPQHDEVRFALRVGAARVKEAVASHLDGPDALHGVDLQRGGGELAGDLAADVFPNAGGEGGVAEGDSTLVVVELHVVGEEARELRQIAMVVGVEDLRVEGTDGFLQIGLGVDLVEGGDGWGLGREEGWDGEKQEAQGGGGEGMAHGFLSPSAGTHPGTAWWRGMFRWGFRAAYVPPFAVRLRRMGHRQDLGE